MLHCLIEELQQMGYIERFGGGMVEVEIFGAKDIQELLTQGKAWKHSETPCNVLHLRNPPIVQHYTMYVDISPEAI